MHLPDRFQSIQALRGVAALLVMVGHLFGAERTHGGDVFAPEWVILGFAGVDLFFVISGFVIAFTAFPLAPTSAAWRVFAWNRLTRLYPMWWLFCGITVMGLIVASGLYYEPEALAGEDPVIYLVKSILLAPQAGLPILPLGWTLTHEVYFYAVFSGFVFLPRRLWPIGLALWGLGLGVLTALGANAAHAEDWLALIAHPLSAEFILGALLGYALRRGFQPPVWSALALAAIWTLALGFGLREVETVTFPSNWMRVALFAPPCFLLVAAGLGAELRSNWRPPAFLIQLGDWSFALYLVHLIIFAGIGRFVWPLFAMPGPVDSLIWLSVMMIASIAASGVIHHGLERPLLRLLRFGGGPITDRLAPRR